jgi:glycosyltransferase involved in cell wall biosynthesis
VSRSAERAIDVLLVSFSTKQGGAERSMIALATHLPAAGLDVVLACPPGEVADAAEARGLTVSRIPVASPGPVRATLGTGRSSRSAVRYAVRNAHGTYHLVRAVRRHRPAVLHSNSLPSHLATTVAGRLTRRSVTWHLREIVRPGSGRHILDAYARGATELVAISDAVAASVRHRRVTTVLNPVIRPATTRPGADSFGLPGPVVGYLGRIEEHKGIVELLEAMADNTAHLVVIGPFPADGGRLRARLAELAQQQATGRVHFVGATAEPWSALAQLDVLVVPSHAEPFGRVAVEGQLAGCAVLAANTGGLPEIVTDGVNGMLFRARDRNDLAAHLARLLADPDLRARLGTAGRSVADRYDPTLHAARMAEVFRRAAGLTVAPTESRDRRTAERAGPG